MSYINYLMILLLFSPLTISGKNTKKKSKPRIIEGKLANQKDFPFIASLQFEDYHMCGGSIVSEYVILTAAHCCIHPTGGPFRINDLSAVVGTNRWRSGRKFKISEVIIHSRYNPSRLQNDIGLWMVSKKLKSKRDNVDKVKLFMSRLNDYSKVYATVIGWGMTSRNGRLVEDATEELMMVELYSVSTNECAGYYDISTGQMCFSSPDRRGSCQGDSGGPLVMERSGEWVQIGLVSYGGDCNNTAPEVYTRLSDYYDWIKTNTKAVTVTRYKKENAK